MLLRRGKGKLNESYTIYQDDFIVNQSNCWFASAMVGYMNNVLKRQLTLTEQWELEKNAYDQFVMPRAGLTVVGGLKRIAGVTGTNFATFAFNSPQMHDYLRAGYVVNVDLLFSDDFERQWTSDEVSIITDCKGKQQGGHVVGVYLRVGKYYLINTWKGYAKEKELQSLNVQGLFKSWNSCGCIVPKE